MRGRMKIINGLLAGQVLQRDKGGRGGASISGSCAAGGNVEIRVLKAGKVARGHNWAPAGDAERNVFNATLTALRAGGPYRVEFRIRHGRKIVDQLGLDDIFVGDVWILAGQSNMEGIGNLCHAPRPHEKVRAFYMRDEWGIAKEPIHFLGEAVDIVHNEYGSGPDRPSQNALAKRAASFVKGMSPGHAFGLEMLKRTKVPQGLIACAHGGTSMEQWTPAGRDLGGASYYGAMIRRYKKLGQPVAGVVWYQGESDADCDAARVYTDKMKALVAATREDMGLPRLPWVIVQMGRHASPDGGWVWNNVQDQQRCLPEVIRHLDVAPAVDLPLDDGIHIGGDGQLILGRRLARLADRLVHKTTGVKPSLTIKAMELMPTPGARPEAPCTAVRLTYNNVVGKLVSNGRASGFALSNHKGKDTRAIYRTILEGKSVVLCTNLSRHELSMLSVSYGHGRDPVCNISDSDGMSLPVMQEMPIDPEHMPYCENWQSVHLSTVKSLARTGFSAIDRARGWRKAHPRAGFGVLPQGPNEKKTGVFALRKTFSASEALGARLFFGANSPFKIWLNGKAVIQDPAATLPLNIDQYRADLKLRRGRNVLHVAYALSEPGEHLGICVRVGTVEEKVDPRIST